MRVATSLLLAVTLLVSGGCGDDDGTTTSSTTTAGDSSTSSTSARSSTSAGSSTSSIVTDPSDGEALLALETTGGLCPDGLCESRWVVQPDGSYTATDQSGEQRTGTVDRSLVEELGAALTSAEVSEMELPPFEDECPTAYDGQEVTVTFPAAGGVSFASCSVEIDFSVSPFQEVDRIREAIREDLVD